MAPVQAGSAGTHRPADEQDVRSYLRGYRDGLRRAKHHFDREIAEILEQVERLERDAR